MSYRNQTRGGYRHHTDPTSSGYYKGSQNVRYRTRGGPSGRGRGNRRPTDDVDSLTVSISDNLTTDTSVRNFRGRVVNSTHRGGGGFGGPRPVGLFNKHTNQSQARQNQTGWWRVSIPKAGHIGKDRVMSILKVHTSRQFQPYHYFIDRDTNMGVFFVNSREEADMLKRANGKLSAQNSETLSIMVGRAAFPAPYLDEDLIRHFRDFIRTRYDMNTNALNLSNLADDEALSAVGIYPQLNKQQFVRDLINIINDNIPMTRFLDLSQNSITNLYEFRNLKLPHLEQLNLSLNQLRAVDELQYLKNLPLLSNLYLRENVLQQSSKNNDDLIRWDQTRDL
ncbi:unnamed protein product [Didymodactylos carnosus]|uniref:Nuclear RNA export factor 1 n=1 Tax=Didymodactylos carnosus TaxID=1234261 RepID=A0A8S2NUQ2_9BILA|nr:unnamed protein product [Didymodactylos carnosus]CAF4018586.1 unnamed protein product [Didymodactylos carnosus]